MPVEIPKQIGKWSCHKLECFADFIEAYARTLKNNTCYYLELYSGCGSCIGKDTNCHIDDSEIRALKTGVKFAGYIFIARDSDDAENLKRLAAPYQEDNKIEIITGNCINEKVLSQLFDLIPRSASSFALIDPGGYRSLRWTTIKKLAMCGSDLKGNKTDLLIIFPLEMALLRNLTRPECEASITRLYGNHKWLEIKQAWADGEIEPDEARKRLVELFEAGLKELGYRHITDFEPKFSSPTFYHAIMASDRDTAGKIMEETWGKPRYLPCELLYDR